MVNRSQTLAFVKPSSRVSPLALTRPLSQLKFQLYPHFRRLIPAVSLNRNNKPYLPYNPFPISPLSLCTPVVCACDMGMDDDIERVLFTTDQIGRRVSELASQITDNFTNDSVSSSPVIVGVATGAFLFLADLVRNIKLPIAVDFIRTDSYGSGTVSNGAPKISFDLKLDVRGKHVILVEDIVDTGNTLSCLIAYLKLIEASSISVCTLLDKPVRRKVHFELLGEGKYYCGFECPDYFVVGYGLDFAERYRNLPYVGILKPELYK